MIFAVGSVPFMNSTSHVVCTKVLVLFPERSIFLLITVKSSPDKSILCIGIPVLNMFSIVPAFVSVYRLVLGLILRVVNFEMFRCSSLFVCLQVGSRSSPGSIQCECHEVSPSVNKFAGGVTVPKVNSINFKNVFSNFASLLSANPTVFATIISLLVLYCLLVIWARHSDKKDLKKVQKHFVIFLPFLIYWIYHFVMALCQWNFYILFTYFSDYLDVYFHIFNIF